MSDGDRRDPRPEPSGGAGAGLFLLYGGALLLLLLVLPDVLGSLGHRTIPYSEFKRHLARGEVLECVIGSSLIEGRILPHGGSESAGGPGSPGVEAGGRQSPAEPFPFRSWRVEDPELVRDLEQAGVRYTGRAEGGWQRILAIWLLPLLLLIAFWLWLLPRLGGGVGGSLAGFGRSRARLVADREVGVRFDDVAGCEEAKAELREIVDFLGSPERFRALGARIPKGVLLVGPPGTGKTLLARAVAGEAGVPFFSLSGSDFIEMFVGVGAARVRDLFQQAKRMAPCIVFIDELDAIGRQRSVHMANLNDEREHTLNQILVELDGFDETTGVIVLAATNRPDVLDPALLRPGRFDRQVVLDAPDLRGREEILRVHARGKPLAPGVDLARIAAATPGFSGADLANAMNEAALLAARRGADRITQRDLEEAVEKVVAGPERRSRRLSEAEKRRVAWHEAGHALVAARSRHADPVRKISIVPRGRAALGYTLQLPTGDRHLISESELRDRLAGLLGGRAAEELVLGEVSSGAENDLEQATALARRAVAQFGMGQVVGLMHCARDEGPWPGRDAGPARLDCSPETAHAIDEEVRELLESAYQQAREILVADRPTLEAVARELLERETLDEARLAELLGSGAGDRDRRPLPGEGAASLSA